MKKTFILPLLIILLTVLGIFLWSRTNTPNGTPGPSPTSTPTPTTTTAFLGDGVLVRNNPGLKPGVWYLVTEQPGAPALSYEVQFIAGSTCTIGGTSINCLNLSMDNGQRVHVEGTLSHGIITVTTLRTVAGEASIRITKPAPNAVVSSPIAISGEATGNWYFEASFPITLKDAKGVTIVQTVAQAEGEWMTTDYVPFTVSLPYAVSVTTSATLIFEKDNPSGLPQFDQQFSIPITLLPNKKAEREIMLYYYNENKDKDASGNIMCSKQGLVSVKRKIPVTNTPIQDTINLLLQGNLTAAEKNQGITTEYPLQGLKLTGASLKSGVLTLSFADPNNKTGGGSCRVGILWSQIEAAAKQFPGVTSVKFIPEELFQP